LHTPKKDSVQADHAQGNAKDTTHATFALSNF
jgi:hypothetical protein